MKGGARPLACDALQRIARAANADENVWRGSQLPPQEQGIKVLRTPPGHPNVVAAHLDQIITEHRVLLERIPSVPDLQSAWLLLLLLCSSPSDVFPEDSATRCSCDFRGCTRRRLVEVHVSIAQHPRRPR